jgi:hypothetical protein
MGIEEAYSVREHSGGKILGWLVNPVRRVFQKLSLGRVEKPPSEVSALVMRMFLRINHLGKRAHYLNVLNLDWAPTRVL